MDENKPRDINELIDLPYSEMSEEEIELVVNFKAEVKARDTAFTERMEEQKRANEETLKINASIAAAAKAQLAELQQMAFDRLKAVENG